jgi:hypothetical protein
VVVAARVSAAARVARANDVGAIDFIVLSIVVRAKTSPIEKSGLTISLVVSYMILK